VKYAVVKAFGHQYKVAEGDLIQTELPGVEVGAEVVLSDVLLVAQGENVTVGQPTVKGAKVVATFEAATRGEKVYAFRYPHKHRHLKLKGHKQHYAQLRIKSIEA